MIQEHLSELLYSQKTLWRHSFSSISELKHPTIYRLYFEHWSTIKSINKVFREYTCWLFRKRIWSQTRFCFLHIIIARIEEFFVISLKFLHQHSVTLTLVDISIARSEENFIFTILLLLLLFNIIYNLI